MTRWALGAALLGVGVAAAATEPGEFEQPGGGATVFAAGNNAFSLPAANLDEPGRTRFAVGNSFFRRNWVVAPASTRARDGLGPHFLARACAGCHINDGRGAPHGPEAGAEQPAAQLLLRLSVPGSGPHGGPRPEPTYGDQFNTLAIPGVRPEGGVIIRYREIEGRYADGTRYRLRSPSYEVREPGYGALAPDFLQSPRVPPQLVGVGLLEAIAEEDILDNARQQARRGDAIRGTPNRVWDAVSRATSIGRFGWKANVASLDHQTAAAFVGDIGITSQVFPVEPCTEAQADCRAAPSGGSPEIDARILSDVVFYQQVLAPPARRDPAHPEVLRGRALFRQADCAVCHRPSYVTARETKAGPALAGQRIFPYTDLLLHDMGEGLADGRPDFLATGRQWRTPPLWAVGLIRDVNGHGFLLHDGRARSVEEAILWHGGEAEASRDRFLRMGARDRRALIRFVESL